MKYRPEIDGLRSVAVVPVILFHAGITVFSGGFVGVDVFFVISGYLITTILITELASGEFSLLRFYERRARRILPALFFVVACCIPFAWMWMLPEQLSDFFQSIVAVTFFASNILFWRESGYFEAAAEEKPLLHTWSLAVEEQYYVLFPLLLMACWRMGPRRVLFLIAGLSVCSLLLSEWMLRKDPTANFYLAPSRVWELLAGSICAFLLRNRAPTPNNPVSLAGLLLIVGAVFLYDERTPFPSLYALAPVGGTVLIILFAAPGTWTARLLSTRVMVGIGLISYSAYLWHQPMFAFARLRSILTPEPGLMMVLAGASFGLAWFSWRFVEQPFRGRTGSLLPTRNGVFIAACAGLVFFAAVGMTGYLNRGFPDRLDAVSKSYLKIARMNNPYRETCQFRHDKPLQPHPVQGCTDFLTGDQIDVAFIGDSHTGAFSYVAQDMLRQRGLSSYAVTYAACLGLPGFNLVDTERRDLNCTAHNEALQTYLIDSDTRIAVLASRFTLYLEGDRFDNEEGGVEYGENGQIDTLSHYAQAVAANDPQRRARVLSAYQSEVRALADHMDVILVYPIPEAGWHVPKMLAMLSRFSSGAPDLALSTSYDVYKSRNNDVIAAFDAIEHPRVHRVRPAQILCDTFVPGRCANAADGQVFYADDDHLSEAGAKLISQAILEQVEAIMAAD